MERQQRPEAKSYRVHLEPMRVDEIEVVQEDPSLGISLGVGENRPYRIKIRGFVYPKIGGFDGIPGRKANRQGLGLFLTQKQVSHLLNDLTELREERVEGEEETSLTGGF